VAIPAVQVEAVPSVAIPAHCPHAGPKRRKEDIRIGCPQSAVFHSSWLILLRKRRQSLRLPPCRSLQSILSTLVQYLSKFMFFFFCVCGTVQRDFLGPFLTCTER
jgi:hypothetical protein